MKWGMRFLSLIAGLSLIFIGEALAQKRGPMQPPVDQAKLQELCKEIQPIYQKEYQLRTEIRAQIWSTTPNWDLVLEKELEATKLRVEMMKKAHEKGLTLRPGYGSIVRYCGWTPGWRW